MIGLLEAGQPVLGAVYVPARDIIYCAEKGAGAWSQLHNRMPKPMHVSATAAIDRMTLVISRSNVSTLDIKIANELQCEYILRVGSVGHKLALVADGEADLYISTRPEVPVWDTCAAHIIIREAGGMITDLSGEPLRYDPEGLSHRHGVVATNGLNHSEIIARVAHTAAGQAV
ncbi:MAG: Inositol monophosphatase [Candidatus Magasanikbacteria bacterium GW2011_GWA2_56_11]|uniref:Inositol monophosphatase n=1 Tax=Candidatus Magasanikbacteria bacterium GW2011_GWA2_56_11 TaxID=1619044 RepID=A0A0G2B7B3_9BACT|nr:MAG: Inositol monophosphatase [Candidatus Magasanikbacteria bacterium GW2011_GWA2_56_11]